MIYSDWGNYNDITENLFNKTTETWPLLLRNILVIDLMQSTMGTGSEQCLTLRVIGPWTLSDPVSGHVIGQWVGECHLTDRWKSISPAWETGVAVKEREGKGGKAGRRWPGPLRGLTWSDRLAGTNTQTHTAFRAGCSAEHTQYTACMRTRGQREKIDKREAKSLRRNVCVTGDRVHTERQDCHYLLQVLPHNTNFSELMH